MSSPTPVKQVLVRELIGESLREARIDQGRTLREVSKAARVSLGYLSEVERGRKEASSELLSAICEALDLPLSVLLSNVAADIGALESVELPETAERVEGNAEARSSVDGDWNILMLRFSDSAPCALASSCWPVLSAPVQATAAQTPSRLSSAATISLPSSLAPSDPATLLASWSGFLLTGLRPPALHPGSWRSRSDFVPAWNADWLDSRARQRQ